MSLVCGICGLPPEEPVLSNTGYVFEKRLIEKHIAATGECPVTKLPLSREGLTFIKGADIVRPQTANSTSIPNLLSTFQNEWDGIVGEAFALKCQLDNVKQQLSHALYQHDASTRVIARLLKEKESMQNYVSTLEKRLSSNREGVSELGVPPEVTSVIVETAKTLLSQRRQRSLPNVRPLESLRNISLTQSHSIHGVSEPGVTCIRVHPRHNSFNSQDLRGPIVVSGGQDATICLFSISKEKTLARLQGHVKRINDLAISSHEEIIVSASADKTLRIWRGDPDTLSYACAHIIKRVEGSVQSVALHPIGSHAADATKGNSWGFHDIYIGRTLRTFCEMESEYNALRFHPDGLIMAGGAADGKIDVWDMKALQKRTHLAGHGGGITGLSFSENGYYLASASADGTVRFWDLRKSLAFQVLTLNDGGPTNAVAFDHTGNYLATASSTFGVHVFENRVAVATVATLSDHTDTITDADIGYDGSFFVSASMDRTIKVYRPPGVAESEAMTV